MKKEKLVVFSGAGMSAESGLKTFRGAGGLWEGHRVEEVATPEAWIADKHKVTRFYNERRKQLFECSPNEGHKAIASLQDRYDVVVITQNIDDLHERGGANKVLHLHGELKKARSESTDLTYELDHWELKADALCPDKGQLRPHVVWFGEPVPMIEEAAVEISDSDILVVVGTSLQVYPAAGLIHYASHSSRRFLIDPNPGDVHSFEIIREGAVKGLRKLSNLL